MRYRIAPLRRSELCVVPRYAMAGRTCVPQGFLKPHRLSTGACKGRRTAEDDNATLKRPLGSDLYF
jgi:hypothetical protein